MPFSAQTGHAFFGAEQRLGRGASQRADGFRLDRLQLAEKKLAADLHLVGFRRAVFRRAALHHVADVNIGAFQRDAFFSGCPFNHLRQKLSGSADERQPLRVLVCPRAFPDKHNFSVRVTGAEYDSIPMFVKAAAFAVAYIVTDFFQRVMVWRERKHWRQYRWFL